MLDRKNFTKLRTEMVAEEERREQLIQKSREVIRASKMLIYAVHRGDAKGASEQRKAMDKLLAELRKITAGHPELDVAGMGRTAFQEYVEAACLQQYAASGDIPSAAELKVDAETYLLGLCDLSGELVRRAIHAAIAGDSATALGIRAFVEELWGELLQFNFRNGDLRRKFDGIKYDLKKLEDLALSLKLKER